MGVSPAILYAGVDEYARHRRYLSEREGGGLADAAERGPFLGRFRRKGGEVFSGELVASAVTGADGRTIAKVLVIRDVTERERAETALRDSEERFRNLVEGTVRGILIDIDGKPVFANRAYARIFGYADPAEILALDSIDGLHAPQERERAARFRRRRLLGGNAPDQYEVQCLRQYGTLIWVEILLRVVTWNGQRAVQSTIVDISERKRTEAALRDSEARFRSIFEHSALGITLTSPEGRYRLVNSAMTRILGYPERQLMAMRYLDIIHPDDRAAERVQRRRLLRGIIDNYMMEQRYVRRDGTICWGMVSASVVRDAKGRVLYSIRQHHDITQRRNMEKSLRASEARFRAVIDNAPVGIVLKDRDGAVLMAGRQYEVWNGLRHGETLGKSIHDFLPREQADLLAADDHQVMATGLGSQREIDVRLADGRVHTFLSVNFPIPGPDGEVANVGVVSTDITQRKRAERELNAAQEELIRKANYDDLTGLPNRVLFLDRLSQSLLRARRDKELVALLFIDLDHFKVVNDTLGHAAGDQLLRQTARRLSRCVREEDTVARLGGDEFTVILPGIATGDDAATVAGKIVRKLNRPFTIEGQEVFATASIGITLYPADGDDAETIVKNADAAMYNAKEYGRNNYRFYTRAINDKAMRMLRLETLLRRALEQGELSVAYQPVVDARAGQVVGFEALARWHSHELGHVPPDQFIALAEERGLIAGLGSWVLKTACRQFKELQDIAGRPLRLAVNVSGRQFHRVKLLNTVAEALQESNLSASSLELEITEGVLMQDLSETLETLKAITDMGIGLSIDDFGTGYSSLSYLKRFPFTSLKIDRSFVNDVTNDPDDAALAKAIINMAHSLGLNVIGEGVEKLDQLDFLLAEGCDLVQGFHFSRPMSAEQCAIFLRAGTTGAPPVIGQADGSRSSLTAMPFNPGPAAG